MAKPNTPDYIGPVWDDEDIFDNEDTVVIDTETDSGNGCWFAIACLAFISLITFAVVLTTL